MRKIEGKYLIELDCDRSSGTDTGDMDAIDLMAPVVPGASRFLADDNSPALQLHLVELDVAIKACESELKLASQETGKTSPRSSAERPLAGRRAQIERILPELQAALKHANGVGISDKVPQAEPTSL